MTKKNGSHAKPAALHVAFVLDRSGSMGHLAEAVVSGVDEFVSELRRDEGDTLFSLTAFDTRFEHVHVAVPLADIPSLGDTGYHPGGMTALFDAVAHTIVTTDERLKAQGRDDEKVMVVVMTDGLENSSTDYTARTLKDLIRAYDGRPNWTFVYLGAAHASLAEAQDAAATLSFERGNAMRWEAEDAAVRKSMSSLAYAAKHRRAASSPKSKQVFADAEQSEADYRNQPGE
jgi:uncharacterized protein YegL